MVINYCFVICAAQRDVQNKNKKKNHTQLRLLKEIIFGNCENDMKQVTVSKTQSLLMYQHVVYKVTAVQ